MLITAIAIFLAMASHSHMDAIRAHHKAAPGTHVELIAYRGWNTAYRMTNGVADLVIVPGIGRIMSYALTGHPETDPIWNNPAEFAKAPAGGKIWTNFGGDKVWPAPQGDWTKYGMPPDEWWPDPAFDSGPATVSYIPDGLRLTNPLSASFNLQLTRDITLQPGQSAVTITDTFRRPQTDPQNRASLPVGLWNVTQIRSDGVVFLPLAKTGNPYVPLENGKDALPNWKTSKGVLLIADRAASPTKVGTLDSNGWMASLYGENILFTEQFAYKPGGSYLDNGVNAEVYTNARPKYIEMETLSPCNIITSGHSLTRTVTWTLQQLPEKPRSIAAAVTATSRSMARQ